MVSDKNLLQIVVGILLLALAASLVPPASGGTYFYEGFDASGIHAVAPTAGETAAGVLHKYDSEQVRVFISQYGIRYVVKAESGNHWVQYEFRNPNAVNPSVNASEKSVTWFNLYENVDIKYTLNTYGLKQELIIHDTPPATKFYERITVSDGVTYQKEENREIWFYYGGERLFRITKPFAIDATGANHDLTITRTNIDGSEHVCIDATRMFQTITNTTYPLDEPAGWFERLIEYISGNAAYNPPYPIIIDPTVDIGGVVYFWDEVDIPTLHATVADDTKISYSAEFDLYLMSVPFYHNNSGSSFAFDETVYLKSNDDENEAYFRWAGEVTFDHAMVVGWDTVAGAPAPTTDFTRAYIYSDSNAEGDILHSYFAYLGKRAISGIEYYPKNGVTLTNYSHTVINNNTFYKNVIGIHLYVSEYNNISHNIAIHNTKTGIRIAAASHNIVIGNIAHNNTDTNNAPLWYGDGIELRGAGSNNTVTNNIANFNEIAGIAIKDTEGNNITYNHATYNSYGLHLSDCQYNTIIGNYMSYNNFYGMIAFDSTNDTIYHNAFVNNTVYNVRTVNDPYELVWDSGSEGNYYSDYTGTDTDGDGIGDTPYLISAVPYITDKYPLMAPYPYTTLKACGADWVNISFYVAGDWSPLYNLSLADANTYYSYVLGVTNNSQYKIDFNYGDGDDYEYIFTCTGEPIHLKACVQVDPLAIPLYLGFDNRVVLFRDISSNFIDHSRVAIYDQTEDVYLQKWTDNPKGYFVFARTFDTDHDVQISIRTFDGVHTTTTVYPMNGTAENLTWTNWTVPLRYNIDIVPIDEYDKPLHNVFVGLSEYAISNPQTWWGYDTFFGHISLGNCSGFTRCDITAEKSGFYDYEATALNWTSKNAMVKGYRHMIVMKEII